MRKTRLATTGASKIETDPFSRASGNVILTNATGEPVRAADEMPGSGPICNGPIPLIRPGRALVNSEQ